MLLPEITRVCLFAGFVFICTCSPAQEFSVLEKRLYAHPSILQLEQQALAAREHASSAQALPDPELSFGLNNVPISSPSFDRYLPSNKAIGVMQMFPSKAGRDARTARQQTRANQIDALIAARFDELRGELIVDILELESIAARRQIALEQNRKYDELDDVVKAEIDAGRPALFRLAEIEGERADVAHVLAELDGQKAQILASITEKTGGVTDPALPELVEQTWTGDPQQFHAVRIASLGTAVADEHVNEARASWKTNWGVHLTYQQRESGRQDGQNTFDGDDWFSVGVRFSIPVWGNNKQAPNVRAAQAERMSAAMHTKSLVRYSIATYESLLAQRQTAIASREILLEKIDAIEAEIEAQRSNYESGSGDYAPIIDGHIAILALRARITVQDTRARATTARANALLVTP